MNGVDTASAIFRGVHVMALASIFGALVFTAVVVRSLPVTSVPSLLRARLGRLGRASVALALATGLAWFVVRTAAISGAHSVSETLSAVPLVALETQFGQLLLVRFVLLLALCSILWKAGSRPTFRARYGRLTLRMPGIAIPRSLHHRP